jgi:hypothetical protein
MTDKTDRTDKTGAPTRFLAAQTISRLCFRAASLPATPEAGSSALPKAAKLPESLWSAHQ